jgi:hypothetical protein
MLGLVRRAFSLTRMAILGADLARLVRHDAVASAVHVPQVTPVASVVAVRLPRPPRHGDRSPVSLLQVNDAGLHGAQRPVTRSTRPPARGRCLFFQPVRHGYLLGL